MGSIANSKHVEGKCLWCGEKLEEPYVDPESDGEIGYNWKLYCDLHCELNNEYE